MARKQQTSTPSYRRLKRKNGRHVAFVELGGKRHYLGQYDAPESREAYHRLIAEWEANGRQVSAPADQITVVEVAAQFMRWAKRYYVKNGQPTAEPDNITFALRPLKALYGRTKASEFGPRALKTVRQKMIEQGNSRGYINKQASRIKQMFKWAVAEELIAPSIYHGLQAVSGLKRGRCEAPEAPPVKPVPEAYIEPVQQSVSKQVAAMIDLQLLTGARPGELVIVRPIDLDTTGGRVLIVAHVRELLEQAVKKLNLIAPELWHRIGIYSAGLKSRDTEHPIIVAGVQSIYKRAEALGHFDLVIIDEAHMIPPDGEGMYRTLLACLKKINPLVRIIGLTATPFRMSSGPICAVDNILNTVCYEIGVRELIVQGYICPLISKAGKEKADTSGLHIRGGEYIAGEVEDLMDQNSLVESACREIRQYTRDRKSCLIFASGVRHGRHVADKLAAVGAQAETVFGDTLSFERDQRLTDFRAGKLKYLVNVNVLTTGFDAPNIDCVAMLRPTMSPGLYYQMVGRGFRLYLGKENCLVLDFASPSWWTKTE